MINSSNIQKILRKLSRTRFKKLYNFCEIGFLKNRTEEQVILGPLMVHILENMKFYVDRGRNEDENR